MTNAEAWFNIVLRPRKPECSLGRTAQDGHLDLTRLLNYDYDDEIVFYANYFISSGCMKSGWCLLFSAER